MAGRLAITNAAASPLCLSDMARLYHLETPR